MTTIPTFGVREGVTSDEVRTFFIFWNFARHTGIGDTHDATTRAHRCVVVTLTYSYLLIPSHASLLSDVARLVLTLCPCVYFLLWTVLDLLIWTHVTGNLAHRHIVGIACEGNVPGRLIYDIVAAYLSYLPPLLLEFRAQKQAPLSIWRPFASERAHQDTQIRNTPGCRVRHGL